MKTYNSTDIILYMIGVVIGITFVGAIIYGFWNLYRWFNWEYGYSEFVEQTIEQMVKKECLK